MAGLTIRSADTDDAEAIHRLIVQTMQETNSKDYPPDVIAEVVESFSRDGVVKRMAGRQVFVATAGVVIVGTASLEGAVVRSVFVLPSRQRHGIGSALMNHVESIARTGHLSTRGARVHFRRRLLSLDGILATA